MIISKRIKASNNPTKQRLVDNAIDFLADNNMQITADNISYTINKVFGEKHYSMSSREVVPFIKNSEKIVFKHKKNIKHDDRWYGTTTRLYVRKSDECLDD